MSNLTEKPAASVFVSKNVSVIEMLEYVIALYGIKDVSEVITKMNQEIKETK